MQTINLDLSEKSIVPLLNAKQAEKGRKFRILLTDNKEAYNIPADAEISIWYSGASGSGNYKDIGAVSAVSVEGNKITVELIAQMLVNPGCGNLCLVISTADGGQLGTWNIPYMVEPRPGMGSAVAKDNYTVFTTLDPTLSASGKAADAGAVGQAFQKLHAVQYTEQDLTENQKARARENMGITYFGVPYSSAEKVIDLSDTVKMYLFAAPNGYDAVVNGEGAIPDYTLTVVKPLQFEIVTVNRPFDAEKITRLHICEGITSIGDYFMYKAPNLKHLSFDDSSKIAHLGKYAFAITQIEGEYYFTGLEDTEIDHVFQYCPKLEGITFGGNITAISERAFRGCIALRYVNNIAQSGTALTLNHGAFWYCTSLESIDVDPVNTTLGNWVFMFAPIDARTESGIQLDSALWKAQGDMCFVQNEWTQEQLAAIRNVAGKSVQLTIPESDNQGTDFNKQFGIFPWEIGGKYQLRATAANGLCGIFTLMHIYNIIYPNRQFNTFYDFIEKGVIPNKIEITQEIYDAYMNDARGQKLISDMSGIVSYEVGSKVSAVDLLLAFSAATSYGDPGTGFWSICKALGWTTTEHKFKNRETDSANDRENCGAAIKQLVLANLAAGKPVSMEVVGAGSPGHGAHAVVPVGYDADTDRFLIIDSTGEFPANVVPLLYWCKFESLITPAKESAIWTFDFGEEITMTHIDDKLNTLLETVNSGFHSVGGTLELANDVPSAGNSAASRYRVECPSGAKIFVLVADEATAAETKKRTDKFYTLGVNCNFTNGTTENDKQCLVSVWAGAQARKTTGGLTADNVDGVSFDSYTLAAGTYHWTAYYWNN